MACTATNSGSLTALPNHRRLIALTLAEIRGYLILFLVENTPSLMACTGQPGTVTIKPTLVESTLDVDSIAKR